MTAQQLRFNIANYILHHYGEVMDELENVLTVEQGSLADYLIALIDSRRWGDETDLIMLARMWNLKITVITPDQELPMKHNSRLEECDIVLISNKSRHGEDAGSHMTGTFPNTGLLLPVEFSVSDNSTDKCYAIVEQQNKLLLARTYNRAKKDLELLDATLMESRKKVHELEVLRSDCVSKIQSVESLLCDMDNFVAYREVQMIKLTNFTLE